MKTDSNVYTIVYATVIVVIVAVLLAVVSQVLGPRQRANALLDTQKQILVALNQDIDNCKNPAALYKELIRDTFYVCASPEKEFFNADEALAMPLAEAKKMAAKSGAPRFFTAVVDGELMFIIPLKGQGLWGGIWGYVALREDLNTIFGINFGHESETPGLGGEIVTEDFRSRFVGKHIKDATGELRSVAVLKVGKAAPEGQEQVDAWTGATITSTGVNDMLATSLHQYYFALVGEEAMNKANELRQQYGCWSEAACVPAEANVESNNQEEE